MTEKWEDVNGVEEIPHCVPRGTLRGRSYQISSCHSKAKYFEKKKIALFKLLCPRMLVQIDYGSKLDTFSFYYYFWGALELLYR